jgi:hypothetical protein
MTKRGNEREMLKQVQQDREGFSRTDIMMRCWRKRCRTKFSMTADGGRC